MSGFAHWLHLQWPAGTVEALPEVSKDFSTGVPGLYIVGDLTGTPLLKFAIDSGTRVVRSMAQSSIPTEKDRVPLVIVGAGVAGLSAAMEAKRLGISFQLIESVRWLDTLENFPVKKPIFTCPDPMVPAGDLRLPEGDLDREGLIASLLEQLQRAGIESTCGRVVSVDREDGGLRVMLEDGKSLSASRVVIAIGRSGDHRKLDVPGEDLDHVSHRLHDPADHRGEAVVVVGGGDSACEAAMSLADADSVVTLVHRGDQLVRPSSASIDGVEQRIESGSLRVEASAQVIEVHPNSVTLQTPAGLKKIEATSVYTMIGREAPLGLLRRSGVKIRGEWTARSWISLLLVMVLFSWIYHWKRQGVWPPLGEWWVDRGGFPSGLDQWWIHLGGAFADPSTLLGTLATSVSQAGFWYSLVYTLVVLVFGIRRMKRRPTQYVRWQTWTLISIQAIPLFLLPYWILPWLGHLGCFDAGWGRSFADALFPLVQDYPPGREYWRAFGLILAWPLFFWNVFTEQPLMWWLLISVIQTFVLLPLAIWRWGKGVYCGWICSCGALAETLGDTQRRKMPRGPWTQKLNFVGQFFLLLTLIMLEARLWSWWFPDHWFGSWCLSLYEGILHGVPLLSYEWTVDLFFSGILGVGLYWHFSGRVWCRFACPLAALMNIYARFSRFRIIADKKRCISCNVCTSVCHQGVDVMAFAQRGIPVEDPQCVRCSACVEECPTMVLRFGEVDREGRVIRLDQLKATI
ncbi:MAG: NAD(P)-binding domain-containing protein [Planctomycetota bacterium]|nr:NAD(P)-binding domain-containing protein [Planctomycetota bacterium]